MPTDSWGSTSGNVGCMNGDKAIGLDGFIALKKKKKNA